MRLVTILRSKTGLLVLLSAVACGEPAPIDDLTTPPEVKPPVAPAIRTDVASFSLDEGGMAGTLSVQLTAMPEVAVAVTVTNPDPDAVVVEPAFVSFTPERFATPQTFAITAAEDSDSSDEMVSLSLGGDGLAAVPIAVTITDDESQVFALNPTRLSVGEGRSSILDVALGTPANLTVTITPSDPAKLSVHPSTLTFTVDNASQAQPVTITAAQDGDFNDDALQLTVLGGALSVDVPVSVLDDDTLNLAIDPTRLTLTEGGQPLAFQVSVTAEPATVIIVEMVTSNIRAARLFPPSVRFTSANWMLPQDVSVVPVDDDNTVDEFVSVRLRISGMPDREVAVTVLDDDQQSMTLDRTNLPLAEGTAGSFTVRLDHEPTPGATVVIAVSDGGAVSVTPASLDFSFQDYATPKSVTVRALHDDDLADEPVTLTLSGTGISAQTVLVPVTDEDTQRLVAHPGALDFMEGRTGTVAVSLAFRPPSAVAVNVLSGNAAVVSPSTARLVFSPQDYDQAQPVYLDAPHDADLQDEMTDVAFTATGVPRLAVPVTVRDDDGD